VIVRDLKTICHCLLRCCCARLKNLRRLLIQEEVRTPDSFPYLGGLSRGFVVEIVSSYLAGTKCGQEKTSIYLRMGDRNSRTRTTCDDRQFDKGSSWRKSHSRIVSIEENAVAGHTAGDARYQTPRAEFYPCTWIKLEGGFPFRTMANALPVKLDDGNPCPSNDDTVPLMVPVT
jgi:hypothetical protein